MQINEDGSIVIDDDYRARVAAALELEVRPAMRAIMKSEYWPRLFDELVDARCEGDAISASIVLELADGTQIRVPFALMGREH